MLLDTSGLLCMLNQADPRHVEAGEFFDAATIRLTHSYVLAELIPLGQRRGMPQPVVIGFADEITIDSNVELVWVDKALHEAGMALLRARPDKGYSLCDAVSFVLMRRYRLDEALSNDHHFTQEGFRKLLG